ncbi:MAG: hypothetical protein ABI353_14305 [Isosphaeraceae bacterium]
MNRTLALLVLMAAWSPVPALAQGPPVIKIRPASEPAPAEPPPTVIKLRPAAEPVPALKYRLVPERRSLTPGNAALFYHRGILMMMMETRSRLTPQENEPPEARAARADELTIANWISGPIAEIPRDQARAALEPFQAVLNEVELGAIRSDCDWGFDQRTEGISLMFPEIQNTRSLSRLVTLRAKLAILDGKTDEAMHWIETGLVLGRHAGQGPFVIQALVGVAIDSMMTHCLEDLIQSPGTPSLYWALADRPRPFIDMRYPMEGERYVLEKELPELNELDQGPWSLDQAQRFADELQRKLFRLAAGEPIPGINVAVPMDMPATARRLGIAAMAAKVYPEARRSLIAGGRPEAQVEAMPIIQVAALYSILEYQRMRDDSYKWMNLPYWQSYGQLDQSALNRKDEKFANPLLALFRLLTPGLNQVRLATVRLDRQLDALQCIEAIRLYAEAHQGALPPTLDALNDAPAPLDPATGTPFHYTVDGDSATLSAPLIPGARDHHSYKVRYILKLVK